MIFVLSGSAWFFFFFQAEDGIRDIGVTGVQTCALPISGRADADPRGRRAGDRIRGRDEWIRAVVEIEQGRLGALEENRLPVLECVLDEEGRVRDVRPKSLRVALDLLCDRFQ